MRPLRPVVILTNATILKILTRITKSKTCLQRVLVSNSPHTLLQQTKLQSLLQKELAERAKARSVNFEHSWGSWGCKLAGILSKITISLHIENANEGKRDRSCGRHIHVPAVLVRANRHCDDSGRKCTSSQHHALVFHRSRRDASHVFRTLSMYLLFRPLLEWLCIISDHSNERYAAPNRKEERTNARIEKNDFESLRPKSIAHTRKRCTNKKWRRRRHDRESDPQIEVNCLSGCTKSLLAQVSLHSGTSD